MDGHVHMQKMRNLFPLSSFSPKYKSTLQVWSGPCRARQVLFNFHKFHSFSTNHCQRKPTNFFHLLCFSIIFFQRIAISFLNTGKYRILFFWAIHCSWELSCFQTFTHGIRDICYLYRGSPDGLLSVTDLGEKIYSPGFQKLMLSDTFNLHRALLLSSLYMEVQLMHSLPINFVVHISQLVMFLKAANLKVFKSWNF